jgi:hypothetical protein
MVHGEESMSVISALFDSVATWFGFVTSCMVSPSGACVPLLAFVALGAAAGAALALVLLAYRAIQRRANSAMHSQDAKREPAAPRRARARARVDETPATV